MSSYEPSQSVTDFDELQIAEKNSDISNSWDFFLKFLETLEEALDGLENELNEREFEEQELFELTDLTDLTEKLTKFTEESNEYTLGRNIDSPNQDEKEIEKVVNSGDDNIVLTTELSIDEDDFNHDDLDEQKELKTVNNITSIDYDYNYTKPEESESIDNLDHNFDEKRLDKEKREKDPDDSYANDSNKQKKTKEESPDNSIEVSEAIYASTNEVQKQRIQDAVKVVGSAKNAVKEAIKINKFEPDRRLVSLCESVTKKLENIQKNKTNSIDSEEIDNDLEIETGKDQEENLELEIIKDKEEIEENLEPETERDPEVKNNLETEEEYSLGNIDLKDINNSSKEFVPPNITPEIHLSHDIKVNVAGR